MTDACLHPGWHLVGRDDPRCTVCGASPSLWSYDEDGKTPNILYTAQAHQIPYHESSLPNLIMVGPRGTGKALKLSTLIPTPQGLTTMEDLTVGDFVLGSDGAPTRVVWKSEPHIDPTGAYEVRFNDGSTIVCGGSHEWLTRSARQEHGSVKTTVEIAITCGEDHVVPFDPVRRIVRIQRTDETLLQCIEVDASDHLYLAGRTAIPTHNSISMRSDAHMRALMVPNYRYLIIRKSIKDLKKSHLIYIDREMKALKGDFHHTDSVARYPNGSRGFFGHCETAADMMNYLSAEYDLLVADEVTTFEKDVILRMLSCVRVPVGTGRVGLFRGGTNKLGPGANFVKKYFYDKAIPPEEDEDYDPDEWGVIEHKWGDNQYIDLGQYRKRLSGLPEHVRRAWINNEWALEGMYFTDFQPFRAGEPWHVIPEMPTFEHRSILQQPWVRIYRAVDWGYYPDPAVCLWIAVLPNKRSIVFKERKWQSTLAADVAKQIRAASEGMRVCETFADPTMFINDGTGVYSIAEIFEQNGVPLTASTNKRDQYGYAIHNYLNTEVKDGQSTYPQLQILAPSGPYGCPDLIRTLPQMIVDPKDANKLGDGEDHHVVALAYMCMSSSVTPAQSYAPQTIPRWMRPKWASMAS